MLLLCFQHGFYMKASVVSCLYCISPSPHLKPCKTGNESKVIKRGFKEDNAVKLQIAHKSLNKTFLEIMQTPAQLSTQHSCYPQTGYFVQIAHMLCHLLQQLVTSQSFLHFSSSGEAFLPLLQVRNQQSEAFAHNDTKRLRRIKELKWTGQALHQPRLPEWSCQFTSALPEKPRWQGRKHTSYLPSLPAEVLNSFLFSSASNTEGSKGKEKRKKKKIKGRVTTISFKTVFIFTTTVLYKNLREERLLH